MHVYTSIAQWQQVRRTLPLEHSIGFVPTMGNLHDGHASLLARSLQENHYTAASIFINPTQFNQAADFTNYPRTLEADLERLTSMGVDYCILPDEQSMYADGYRYQIEEQRYTRQMEGLQRPGHFTGVLTVVMKLLQLVKPQRAYFGEKDYQQLQLIRDMVSAFFMDIEIKACPTLRETSGLAYSSRNSRLNPKARLHADHFAHIFHQAQSCQQAIDELSAINVNVEYIEEHDGRRFAAVNIGGVRLIDNYQIEQTAG